MAEKKLNLCCLVTPGASCVCSKGWSGLDCTETQCPDKKVCLIEDDILFWFSYDRGWDPELGKNYPGKDDFSLHNYGGGRLPTYVRVNIGSGVRQVFFVCVWGRGGGERETERTERMLICDDACTLVLCLFEFSRFRTSVYLSQGRLFKLNIALTCACGNAFGVFGQLRVCQLRDIARKVQGLSGKYLIFWGYISN